MKNAKKGFKFILCILCIMLSVMLFACTDTSASSNNQGSKQTDKDNPSDQPTKKVETFTIAIHNGASATVESYDKNTVVTATADEVENAVFICWNRNNQPYSYENSFSYIVEENCIFKAVYTQTASVTLNTPEGALPISAKSKIIKSSSIQDIADTLFYIGGKVEIVGIICEGETLRVNTVPLSGGCSEFSYKWQSADSAQGEFSDILIDGKKITTSTYTLTKQDTGKVVRVAVTGTGLYKGTVYSEATPVVAIEAAKSAAQELTASDEKGDKTLTTKSEVTILKDYYFSLPIPEYRHHTFVGWYTQEGTQITDNKGVSLAVSDGTSYSLYPQYIDNKMVRITLYTLVDGKKTYVDRFGCFIEDGYFRYTAQTVSGHDCIGWYDENDRLVSDVGNPSLLTVLISGFEEEEEHYYVAKYRVAYHIYIDGGAGSGYYVGDETLSLSANSYIGKEFSYWSVATDIGEYRIASVNSETALIHIDNNRYTLRTEKVFTKPGDYQAFIQSSGEGNSYLPVYTAQAYRPDNWSTGYSNYYYKDKNGNFIQNESNQWELGKFYYASSCTVVSNLFTPNSSIQFTVGKESNAYKLTFEALTSLPSDWEDRYYCFFTKEGDEYLVNTSSTWQANKYYRIASATLLTEKPSDWETDYTSYFVSKAKYAGKTSSFDLQKATRLGLEIFDNMRIQSKYQQIGYVVYYELSLSNENGAFAQDIVQTDGLVRYIVANNNYFYETGNDNVFRCTVVLHYGDALSTALIQAPVIAHYEFTQWQLSTRGWQPNSGHAIPSSMPRLTDDEQIILVGNYQPETIAVTISLLASDGANGCQVSIGSQTSGMTKGNFDYGSTISIFVTAGKGYQFASWTNLDDDEMEVGAVGSNNTIKETAEPSLFETAVYYFSYTVGGIANTADKFITPHFETREYKITYNLSVYYDVTDYKDESALYGNNITDEVSGSGIVIDEITFSKKATGNYHYYVYGLAGIGTVTYADIDQRLLYYGHDYESNHLTKADILTVDGLSTKTIGNNTYYLLPVKTLSNPSAPVRYLLVYTQASSSNHNEITLLTTTQVLENALGKVEYTVTATQSVRYGAETTLLSAPQPIDLSLPYTDTVEGRAQWNWSGWNYSSSFTMPSNDLSLSGRYTINYYYMRVAGDNTIDTCDIISVNDKNPENYTLHLTKGRYIPYGSQISTYVAVKKGYYFSNDEEENLLSYNGTTFQPFVLTDGSTEYTYQADFDFYQTQDSTAYSVKAKALSYTITLYIGLDCENEITTDYLMTSLALRTDKTYSYDQNIYYQYQIINNLSYGNKIDSLIDNKNPSLVSVTGKNVLDTARYTFGSWQYFYQNGDTVGSEIITMPDTNLILLTLLNIKTYSITTEKVSSEIQKYNDIGVSNRITLCGGESVPSTSGYRSEIDFYCTTPVGYSFSSWKSDNVDLAETAYFDTEFVILDEAPEDWNVNHSSYYVWDTTQNQYVPAVNATWKDTNQYAYKRYISVTLTDEYRTQATATASYDNYYVWNEKTQSYNHNNNTWVDGKQYASRVMYRRDPSDFGSSPSAVEETLWKDYTLFKVIPASTVSWDIDEKYALAKYAVLASKPNDWDTNYATYYCYEYRRNTSSSWDSNNTYASYANGEYSVLPSKPLDWDTEYASYYISGFFANNQKTWDNDGTYAIRYFEQIKIISQSMWNTYRASLYLLSSSTEEYMLIRAIDGGKPTYRLRMTVNSKISIAVSFAINTYSSTVITVNADNNYSTEKNGAVKIGQYTTSVIQYNSNLVSVSYGEKLSLQIDAISLTQNYPGKMVDAIKIYSVHDDNRTFNYPSYSSDTPLAVFEPSFDTRDRTFVYDETVYGTVSTFNRNVYVLIVLKNIEYHVSYCLYYGEEEEPFITLTDADTNDENVKKKFFVRYNDIKHNDMKNFLLWEETSAILAQKDVETNSVFLVQWLTEAPTSSTQESSLITYYNHSQSSANVVFYGIILPIYLSKSLNTHDCAIALNKTAIEKFSASYNTQIDTLSLPTTLGGRTVTQYGYTEDSVIYGFSDSTKIKAVDFADSILSVNESAFRNCTSLTEITLDTNLQQIGSNAFNGCSLLTTVHTPSEGEYTTGLVNLNLIASYAFANTALTKVIIPANGNTTIQEKAFSGISSLSHVYYDNNQNVITLDEQLFYNSGSNNTVPYLLNESPVWNSSVNAYYRQVTQAVTLPTVKPDDWSLTYRAYYSISYNANNSSVWDGTKTYYAPSLGSGTNIKPKGDFFVERFTQNHSSEFKQNTYYRTGKIAILEKPSDWDTAYMNYEAKGYVLNTSNHWDLNTVYYKYENQKLVPLTYAPSDWADAYDTYYIYSQLGNNHTDLWDTRINTYFINIDGYELLEEKPDDWDTNYTSYYTVILVRGTIEVGTSYTYYPWDGTFETLSSKPSNWENNYNLYYLQEITNGQVSWKNNTVYYREDGFLALNSQPSDWDTNYGSYYLSGITLHIGTNVTVLPYQLFGVGNTSDVLNNRFLKKIDFEESSNKVTVRDKAFMQSGLQTFVYNERINALSNSMFANCTQLFDVTLSESITTIPTGCFTYCTQLTSIVLPAKITSVQSTAFSGTTNLTDVYYSPVEGVTSLTSIGQSAFAPNHIGTTDYESGLINFVPVNSGLTGVILPDSITSIGQAAFYKCSGITSLTLLSTTSLVVGENAFLDTYGLTTILYKVTASSVTVPSNVFNLTTPGLSSVNCTVTIDDSVTAIPSTLFNGANNVTTLTIGENVTSLGERAFAYMTKLATVNLNATCLADNLSSSGKYFDKSGADITIHLAENCTQIPGYLFASCPAVKTADFSLLTGDFLIGTKAFYGTQIESVTFPTMTKVDIGAEAFANNEYLTSVVIEDDISSVTLRKTSFPDEPLHTYTVFKMGEWTWGNQKSPFKLSAGSMEIEYDAVTSSYIYTLSEDGEMSLESSTLSIARTSVLTVEGSLTLKADITSYGKTEESGTGTVNRNGYNLIGVTYGLDNFIEKKDSATPYNKIRIFEGFTTNGDLTVNTGDADAKEEITLGDEATITVRAQDTVHIKNIFIAYGSVEVGGNLYLDEGSTFTLSGVRCGLTVRTGANLCLFDSTTYQTAGTESATLQTGALFSVDNTVYLNTDTSQTEGMLLTSGTCSFRPSQSGHSLESGINFTLTGAVQTLADFSLTTNDVVTFTGATATISHKVFIPEINITLSTLNVTEGYFKTKSPSNLDVEAIVAETRISKFVSSVGYTTFYPTLLSSLDYAINNDTVVLRKNISSTTFTLSAKSIVLNLNNKSLTFRNSNTPVTVSQGSTLNVGGGGNIFVSDDSTLNFLFDVGGIMQFNNENIFGTDTTVFETPDTKLFTVGETGTLVVKGNNAYDSFGKLLCLNQGTTSIINFKFKGNNTGDKGIYMKKGTLNILNSEIECSGNVLYTDNGTDENITIKVISDQKQTLLASTDGCAVSLEKEIIADEKRIVFESKPSSDSSPQKYVTVSGKTQGIYISGGMLSFGSFVTVKATEPRNNKIGSQNGALVLKEEVDKQIYVCFSGKNILLENYGRNNDAILYDCSSGIETNVHLTFDRMPKAEGNCTVYSTKANNDQIYSGRDIFRSEFDYTLPHWVRTTVKNTNDYVTFVRSTEDLFGYVFAPNTSSVWSPETTLYAKGTFITVNQQPADWAQNYDKYYYFIPPEEDKNSNAPPPEVTPVYNINTSRIWNDGYIYASCIFTFVTSFDKPADWNEKYQTEYYICREQTKVLHVSEEDTFFIPQNYCIPKGYTMALDGNIVVNNTLLIYGTWNQNNGSLTVSGSSTVLYGTETSKLVTLNTTFGGKEFITKGIWEMDGNFYLNRYKKIDVYGDFDCHSKLYIRGIFNFYGRTYNYTKEQLNNLGTLVIKSTGTANIYSTYYNDTDTYNNGTFLVHEDGVLLNRGIVYNYGTLTIQEDGLYQQSDADYAIDEDTHELIYVETALKNSGTFTVTNGGTFRIKNIYDADAVGVYNSGELRFETGSNLFLINLSSTKEKNLMNLASGKMLVYTNNISFDNTYFEDIDNEDDSSTESTPDNIHFVLCPNNDKSVFVTQNQTLIETKIIFDNSRADIIEVTRASSYRLLGEEEPSDWRTSNDSYYMYNAGTNLFSSLVYTEYYCDSEPANWLQIFDGLLTTSYEPAPMEFVAGTYYAWTPYIPNTFYTTESAYTIHTHYGKYDNADTEESTCTTQGETVTNVHETHTFTGKDGETVRIVINDTEENLITHSLVGHTYEYTSNNSLTFFEGTHTSVCSVCGDTLASHRHVPSGSLTIINGCLYETCAECQKSFAIVFYAKAYSTIGDINSFLSQYENVSCVNSYDDNETLYDNIPDLTYTTAYDNGKKYYKISTKISTTNCYLLIAFDYSIDTENVNNTIIITIKDGNDVVRYQGVHAHHYLVTYDTVEDKYFAMGKCSCLTDPEIIKLCTSANTTYEDIASFLPNTIAITQTGALPAVADLGDSVTIDTEDYYLLALTNSAHTGTDPETFYIYILPDQAEKAACSFVTENSGTEKSYNTISTASTDHTHTLTTYSLIATSVEKDLPQKLLVRSCSSCIGYNVVLCDITESSDNESDINTFLSGTGYEMSHANYLDGIASKTPTYKVGPDLYYLFGIEKTGDSTVTGYLAVRITHDENSERAEYVDISSHNIICDNCQMLLRTESHTKGATATEEVGGYTVAGYTCTVCGEFIPHRLNLTETITWQAVSLRIAFMAGVSLTVQSNFVTDFIENRFTYPTVETEGNTYFAIETKTADVYLLVNFAWANSCTYTSSDSNEYSLETTHNVHVSNNDYTEPHTFGEIRTTGSYLYRQCLYCGQKCYYSLMLEDTDTFASYVSLLPDGYSYYNDGNDVDIGNDYTVAKYVFNNKETYLPSTTTGNVTYYHLPVKQTNALNKYAYVLVAFTHTSYNIYYDETTETHTCSKCGFQKTSSHTFTCLSATLDKHILGCETCNYICEEGPHSSPSSYVLGSDNFYGYTCEDCGQFVYAHIAISYENHASATVLLLNKMLYDLDITWQANGGDNSQKVGNYLSGHDETKTLDGITYYTVSISGGGKVLLYFPHDDLTYIFNNNSKQKHTATCSCGYEKQENHTFVNITEDDSVTGLAVLHKQCDYCGYKEKIELNFTHTATYDDLNNALPMGVSYFNDKSSAYVGGTNALANGMFRNKVKDIFFNGTGTKYYEHIILTRDLNNDGINEENEYYFVPVCHTSNQSVKFGYVLVAITGHEFDIDIDRSEKMERFFCTTCAYEKNPVPHASSHGKFATTPEEVVLFTDAISGKDLLGYRDNNFGVNPEDISFYYDETTEKDILGCDNTPITVYFGTETTFAMFNAILTDNEYNYAYLINGELDDDSLIATTLSADSNGKYFIPIAESANRESLSGYVVALCVSNTLSFVIDCETTFGMLNILLAGQGYDYCYLNDGTYSDDDLILKKIVRENGNYYIPIATSTNDSTCVGYVCAFFSALKQDLPGEISQDILNEITTTTYQSNSEIDTNRPSPIYLSVQCDNTNCGLPVFEYTYTIDENTTFADLAYIQNAFSSSYANFNEQSYEETEKVSDHIEEFYIHDEKSLFLLGYLTQYLVCADKNYEVRDSDELENGETLIASYSVPVYLFIEIG